MAKPVVQPDILYRDVTPTLQSSGVAGGPVGAGQEICRVTFPTDGTYEITVQGVGSALDGNLGNGGPVAVGDETTGGDGSLFQLTSGVYEAGIQTVTFVVTKTAGSFVKTICVFSMPAGDTASAFITARLVD